MDKGFELIYEKFTKDMQESGIFVAPSSKNRWGKERSFLYDVRVGLHKRLGYSMPSSDGATCVINFRGDRSTKETKEKNDYELTLPGHIERSAISLRAMADGVRLITTLDFWAYNNGKLVFTDEPSDSKNAIRKHFVLNKNLIEKEEE